LNIKKGFRVQGSGFRKRRFKDKTLTAPAFGRRSVEAGWENGYQLKRSRKS
jgi:hypothetical protein